MANNEATETVWDKAFAGKHGAGRIGDVLIVIIDGSPGPSALAAWGEAVETHLLAQGRRPRFPTQVYLPPAAATKLAESLTRELKTKKNGTAKVIQHLQTSELRDVIAALRDQPKNSAVALLGLETIRAHDVASKKLDRNSASDPLAGRTPQGAPR